jgi:DNA-directed RNA polymerase specialized sigma24 family protein
MAVKDTDAGTSRDTVVALREAFLRRYLPLLRLATLLSQEPHTAEDLVQESFVRAAPRLPELSPDEVLPYLRRTVVNVWKNAQRRASLFGKRQWLLDEPRMDADPADTELVRRLLRLA